jgi:hypothetical protein
VRRILGLISLILGLTLILLVPFLLIYAVPRVEKAPTDVYDITVLRGNAQYLNVYTFSLTDPYRSQLTQIAKGDPAKSTKDVAVISFFNRTVDTVHNTPLAYSLDIYAMDRRTGYAVHCCGEKPRHEGVTLKFPFGTQKKTYPLWDSTAVRAFPARYVGTEVLDGLETYKFQSDVHRTFIGNIDLPGLVVDKPQVQKIAVPQYYAAKSFAWIDPVTGQVIKGAQDSSQWVEDGNGNITAILAIVDLVYTPETIKGNVDEASANIRQLRIVKFWVPVVGPIVGVGLVAVGWFLMRVTRRPEPAAAEPPGP